MGRKARAKLMDRSKPHFVDGIDITRVFTSEEIFELHAKGKLRPIALEGYCTRADADGTIRFIPWYESTHFRQQTGTTKSHVSYDFVDAMRAEVEHEHPMVRRTPQEKVAAMMLRLMGEVKRTGTITGLPAEQIAAITGESWKQGEPLSAEAVRRVAAHFLGIGEVDNKEADRHRVTRVHALA